MKALLITVVLILLTGCTGRAEEVTVRVVKVYTTSANSEDCRVQTLVKTRDNRADNLCGDWGDLGEEIKGVWVSGHHMHSMNGFKTQY